MGETELVCAELGPALDELKASGHRLELIYPAEEPHTAVLTKGGAVVRLTNKPGAPEPTGELSPFEPEFLLTRGNGAPGEGRAGMLYRDLIPGRLGGRYIASHITIRRGGPVADWVHFHQVRFQLIYVRSGWVRVAYEDQGEAFVMKPGDLVLQPPQIRHRVLESSDGLEVIEIGCPALHATFADHGIELPNGERDASRRWSGQSFLRHIAAESGWSPFAGGEVQETRIDEATGGLADVRTIRATGGKLDFAGHEGELVFAFVLSGTAELHFDGEHRLCPADAFTIPPREPWSISGASSDFRLLHVTSAELA